MAIISSIVDTGQPAGSIAGCGRVRLGRGLMALMADITSKISDQFMV
jgi:hypothetical protein